MRAERATAASHSRILTREMARTRTSIIGLDGNQIVRYGAGHGYLNDLYHFLLTRRWGTLLAMLFCAYLTTNVLFAALYLLGGDCIENARAGSFTDAFFFSVQTMGTIGYGVMAPETPAANTLVVVESIVGLTLTALATGLVFAKFSRSRARVAFSRNLVIGPMNGVPTLMIRLGNERGNQIVDARMNVAMGFKEVTSEGSTFYRTVDLALGRDHALSLSRSWTIQHTIDAASPLRGVTPARWKELEIEISVLVVGVDDVTMQPVHASHLYVEAQWGARHADVLSETDDGNLVLDLRRFHDTEPTAPTADFPYP